MPYTAPLGDAVDFSRSTGTYSAPLGDAVDFPAPDDESPAIPFVRGPASGLIVLGGSSVGSHESDIPSVVGDAIGRVSIRGLVTGIHASPKWVRFGSASGSVLARGSSIGAVGVSGLMSGKVSPKPARPNGVRVVPRINPKTGAIEMVDTLPPCLHHSLSSFQP